MHSNNRQVIWLRPTSRDNNIQFASLRYQLDSTHNTSCIPHRRSEGLVKAITTVKYWKLVVVGPEYSDCELLDDLGLFSMDEMLFLQLILTLSGMLELHYWRQEWLCIQYTDTNHKITS
ncbi:hypothetical protein KY285_005247 [Solanum tuberosum]|nr:hypothetical protein KY289_005767 [Solanum tuberosum]KAH0752099.1 hypothetical protein KY285_005247 [Solanum tuberosum]